MPMVYAPKVRREERDFNTIDDFDLEEKTVLLRVDLNSPIDPKTGVITDDSRILEHAQTIQELSVMKAKTVVLAHQGRKGSSDFTSLEQHAQCLGRILRRSISFVPDTIGGMAIDAIKDMSRCGVLVLENVRFLDEEVENKSVEEHAQGELVKRLAPLADIFINDAFSAAHRSHASVVGFTAVLPSAAGRVMESELKALSKVADRPEKPCIYLIGGGKPKEKIGIVEHVLADNIADLVLISGLLANIFLAAEGTDLGEANREVIEKNRFTPFVERARSMLQKFGSRIVLPIDLAVDINGRRVEIVLEELPTRYLIKDIGSKTAELYGKRVSTAKSVVMNGPAGVYEEEAFQRGTDKLLTALSKSRCHSVVGGGNTIAAVNKLNLRQDLYHVSTAGGALISYLSGEELPAVEALKKAFKRRAG